MRDRSQTLHGRAEQPAERLGFRLAQLRELGRHVRDRAVMLAELLAARIMGARTVGARTVGARTVGARTVGARTVGARTAG
jgi:hypothetical protein